MKLKEYLNDNEIVDIIKDFLEKETGLICKVDLDSNGPIIKSTTKQSGVIIEQKDVKMYKFTIKSDCFKKDMIESYDYDQDLENIKYDILCKCKILIK